MDTAQALAFLLFAFIAAVTPGPSNTMILSTGATVGTLRGIGCPLGASLGMGVMIVLSAFGVGEIVAAVPTIVTAMKVAGSLFLLWLAWKIVNAGTFEADSPAQAAGFLQAFLFQWLNPKGWLVAVSAGSTYLVSQEHAQTSGVLWMGTLFAAAAFPAGLLWLVLGALMAQLLRAQRSAKLFNIAMASALAVSVVLVWR
ncbi:LysE family translocator [Rhizobium sp. 3T7]|uniref:LysE family translocator n=1 Tax=Rhizobium sp. 3T7 TaxID=2874922 RepID=UPI001CC92DF6|nr:LysE family translocator [Rhizobium sp. 3T7]MBZ9788940.1 LysE family translocator [Rhizobium sp. 3T7]